jgi:hypothetical protein
MPRTVANTEFPTPTVINLVICQMGWNCSELMIIVIFRVVLYSTFNLEDFAIVWLHARSCVTILCRTPAHGLYGRTSDTSTPSI